MTPGVNKGCRPSMVIGDGKKERGSIEDRRVHIVRVIVRKDVSTTDQKNEMI